MSQSWIGHATGLAAGAALGPWRGRTYESPRNRAGTEKSLSRSGRQAADMRCMNTPCTRWSHGADRNALVSLIQALGCQSFDNPARRVGLASGHAQRRRLLGVTSKLCGLNLQIQLH